MKFNESTIKRTNDLVQAKVEGSSALAKIDLFWRIREARNAISIALGIDEKKILIEGITLLVKTTQERLEKAKLEIGLQFMCVTRTEPLLPKTV